MRDLPDNLMWILVVLIAGTVLVWLVYFASGCTIQSKKIESEYQQKQLQFQHEIRTQIIEQLKVPPVLLDQLDSDPIRLDKFDPQSQGR